MSHISPAWSILIWGIIYVALLFFAETLFRGKLCSKLLKKKRNKWLAKILSFGGIYLLIKIFFFDIYRVSGNSMQPTLLDGDYVLISKFAYGSRLPRSLSEVPYLNMLTLFYPLNLWSHDSAQEYKRLYSKRTVKANDIIIFNIPAYQKYYGIKRCVNVPGDAIFIGDPNTSDRCINTLPYLGQTLSCMDSMDIVKRRIIMHYYPLLAGDSLSSYTFSHSYYYVEGDNKKSSTDSRTWGALQDDHIIGKACIILMSRDKSHEYRKDRFLKKLG